MIKKTFIFGFLIITALTSISDVESYDSGSWKTSQIFLANKSIGRGINIGNALEAPKEGEWGVTLKSEYFKIIKEAGFNTVRLPIKWSAHARSVPPYTIDPVFAKRVDWAIRQAFINNLNIIINVHHYTEIDNDPDKHTLRLISLWKQISSRYKNYPSNLYFELLNEPGNRLDGDKWNVIVNKLLATVRRTNSSRPIIVGPVQQNSIWALNKLNLPENDPNLIVTIHYYDPFKFTHQGTHWVEGADQWQNITWTGTESEKFEIRKSLQYAARWARRHSRPIFLGEFGVYNKADMRSRSLWNHFVAREAEKLGMSWAYWEFCAGFGAYDPQNKRWWEEIKFSLIE